MVLCIKYKVYIYNMFMIWTFIVIIAVFIDD